MEKTARAKKTSGGVAPIHLRKYATAFKPLTHKVGSPKNGQRGDYNRGLGGCQSTRTRAIQTFFDYNMISNNMLWKVPFEGRRLYRVWNWKVFLRFLWPDYTAGADNGGW
jgi:hypothetical protein